MLFLFPIIGILAISGFASSVAQNPFQIALDRIKPDPSRVSPGKGWHRLLGVQGLAEFLKAFFKFVAVGVVTFIMLRSEQAKIVNAMLMEARDLPELLLDLSKRILAAVCVSTVALVAGDLVWSRFSWRRNLRMTREELKEEHKQSDGDPLVKAKQRSLARDRQRKRMMTQVPRATLVIANPTHYAVALRYVREEGGAPVVLAKGKDLIALKIREIAENHQIPVIEDKLLARALCEKVEVDRMIPSEFYQAVAQIVYLISTRNSHYTSAS
jgi:flagellar biosynthetic protein FlhB